MTIDPMRFQGASTVKAEMVRGAPKAAAEKIELGKPQRNGREDRGK